MEDTVCQIVDRRQAYEAWGHDHVDWAIYLTSQVHVRRHVACEPRAACSNC